MKITYTTCILNISFLLWCTALGAQQHVAQKKHSYFIGKNTSATINELRVLAGQKKILHSFQMAIVSVNAAHREASVKSAVQEKQDKNNTSNDMFDVRGGYFHPYVSLRGEWTDNLYNINVDEVDNFLTVVSPGIWVGLPRMNKIPVSLSPHNAAVGGKRYSVPGKGSFDRFQSYLLGGLDYKNYSADSELDHTSWRLEGLFQYNLPAGISFRFLDRFTQDRDRYDMGSFIRDDFTVSPDNIYVTSSPSRVRNYYSNQANIAVNLDMSEKFSAHFDYINFYLDYDEDINDWLNRIDNVYSLSLSYNHSPKTSVFIQYNHAFLSYESDTTNDSQNLFLYGGLNWQGSAKTSLMAKAGYQQKNYDNISDGDTGSFTTEIQFSYLVTDKTKIAFNLYKALEETDSLANRGKDTIAFKFRYDQNFTYRIKGHIELWYEQNDYDGFDRTEDNLYVDDRNDNRYMVRPAIQYIICDWLMGELAYTFEDRNSNEDLYDFTTQTVILSLNAAL